MKEQLLEVLEDINPGVDYENCTTLITDRHIDSLSMVALVPELEDTFDIEIPPVEIVAENFNSVDAMLSLIERLQEEDLD
ncbi:MAG: acyl carrier protein [Atopobiaceae bacterium]|nr:acyl carrier protein [Atopobiaceae bacterium]